MVSISILCSFKFQWKYFWLDWISSLCYSRTETESCYLAYLSIAADLGALRLRSILWTFLQSFNYNNFITYLTPFFKSNQVQNW